MPTKANPLSKFQSVLKRIRKEHPRMSFKDAQAKASRAYHNTTKVSGKKPTKIKVVKRVGHNKKRTSPVQRGISISRRIDDLECFLKNTTGTEARNRVKRLINAEHDKLDVVSKNLKSA